MPNISVIIPTYNRAKYLPEAIDSVLSQTYQDLEIIIVDDGSVDDTKAIVNSYLCKHQGKIKYVFQPNRGPGAARNRGIENSKSTYISFLDSDDLYSESYIKECLDYLQNNDYDFVIPQQYYEKELRSDKVSDLTVHTHESLPSDPKRLYKELFYAYIGSVMMVVKRECFEKCDLFDENLVIWEDWDMWVRFAQSGFRAGLVKSNSPLWVRVKRKDSLWHSPSNAKKRVDNYFYALEKHRKQAVAMDRDLKKVYAKKYWEIGTSLLRVDSNKFDAVSVLLKSQLFEPNIKRIFRSIFT